MSGRMTLWAVIAPVLAGAPAALGQSFNIDCGVNMGTPSSTYGAAAAQPGAWANPAIPGVITPIPLTDITGASTGVTVQCAGPVFDFFFDNLLTTGDHQALLDDLLDLSNLIGVPINFVFTGLAPGTYDIYTYAWAPDNPVGFITSIAVNGLPAQNVGGADWTGAHVLGATYALHNVTITAGQTITVAAATVAGFGSLNGFQIVPEGQPCYPDCNMSGSLTVADFTCFQGQFLQQTAYGDCNNSGTWTVADFTCFQIAYLNGCP